jgi:hypothetical protein
MCRLSAASQLLLELLRRQRFVPDDRQRMFSELHVNGSWVFARFIAGLPLSDREFNLAPLGELVELNPAQTRQVKEELAPVLTFDEAKLTV